MTFRQNIIKARSHIVFLAALLCGLALVTWIDSKEQGTASQATGHSNMAAFENITPLKLAVTGVTSDTDIA